ncbi:hypothetical protein RFI_12864 [Reticulomyxa filosa]|uniref:Uncharacterized protein n=1 Tax=Reticulomyxa filosa TaxID=46433 RepID=X6NEV7_RETFI|nr:hypothetical protein RFI_12864 [Reticulomyxa filosa]|eukprot:ETO24294.1 hypothetical protein RFI_12864 [Reticulomyxa filosa]
MQVLVEVEFIRKTLRQFLLPISRHVFRQMKKLLCDYIAQDRGTDYIIESLLVLIHLFFITFCCLFLTIKQKVDKLISSTEQSTNVMFSCFKEPAQENREDSADTLYNKKKTRVCVIFVIIVTKVFSLRTQIQKAGLCKVFILLFFLSSFMPYSKSKICASFRNKQFYVKILTFCMIKTKCKRKKDKFFEKIQTPKIILIYFVRVIVATTKKQKKVQFTPKSNFFQSKKFEASIKYLRSNMPQFGVVYIRFTLADTATATETFQFLDRQILYALETYVIYMCIVYIFQSHTKKH